MLCFFFPSPGITLAWGYVPSSSDSSVSFSRNASPAWVEVILPSKPTLSASRLNGALWPCLLPTIRWTFSCTSVSRTSTALSSTGEIKISVVPSPDAAGLQHWPTTPFFLPGPPGKLHETRYERSGITPSMTGANTCSSIIKMASVSHSSRVSYRLTKLMR